MSDQACNSHGVGLHPLFYIVRKHLESRVNLVVKANQSLSLLKGTPKNIKKTCWQSEIQVVHFWWSVKKRANLYLIVFPGSESLFICRNKKLLISQFLHRKFNIRVKQKIGVIL